MQALGILVHVLLIAGVIGVPLVLAAKNYGCVKVNIYAIPVCLIILWITVYWPEYFGHVRLELIGFDFDGMNDADRVRNVPAELREEALRLYWSHMGVGWPLKAIMASVMLLPYPTLAYFLIRLAKLIRGRFSRNAPPEQG